METNGKQENKRAKARSVITTPRRTTKTELPLVQGILHGYDADKLMKETAKLRKITTKRGTLEILIPLCCTTTSASFR